MYLPVDNLCELIINIYDVVSRRKTLQGNGIIAIFHWDHIIHISCNFLANIIGIDLQGMA